MGGGRALGRSGGQVTLLLLLVTGARAQVVPNRATRYLQPTDVTDARALWVNPAGLGRFEEASLALDLTVGDPGSAGRLRQLTVGFNSRGLSFGYQRDIFDAGRRGHTYRLGYAAGQEPLAVGIAVALYRGATSATGWEAGALYDAAPTLTLGAVLENIGRPTVRDSTLPVTYVPSATWRVLGSRGAVSAHARFTAHGVTGYALAGRVGLQVGATLPVGVLARVDTDRSLKHPAFAFGISVGREDVAGAVVTTPADVGRLDALSLYGISTHRLRH